MLKRTSLFGEHQKLGARLVDFGGWELPVQYAGIIDEHLNCRMNAGIFDVSHMGEIHVQGADSGSYLDFLVSNDVKNMSVGQAIYSVMCNLNGGAVDDLVIYRRAFDRFLVVVNASNTEKDFNHMVTVYNEYQYQWGDLQVTNESARYSQIAIQGPKSRSILSKITETALEKVKTYWFSEGVVLNNIPAIFARTGYTGEDGFEIYIDWNSGPEVWRALMEAGQTDGLRPCGLGARDTLRLEMKYPLYGNELTDETLPLEAGLGWVVKLNKADFIGRDRILEASQRGLNRKLIGFKLLEKGIPRHGYLIYNEEGTQRIGEVTSGSQSPSLNRAIGIGYVDIDSSKIGTKLTIEIRHNKYSAEVVATPFYKRPYAIS